MNVREAIFRQWDTPQDDIDLRDVIRASRLVLPATLDLRWPHCSFILSEETFPPEDFPWRMRRAGRARRLEPTLNIYPQPFGDIIPSSPLSRLWESESIYIASDVAKEQQQSIVDLYFLSYLEERFWFFLLVFSREESHFHGLILYMVESLAYGLFVPQKQV